MRPPDLLVNVVVSPPNDHTIMGEVQVGKARMARFKNLSHKTRARAQVHLRDILLLKENSLHRLYELERASAIEAVIAEAESAKAKQKLKQTVKTVSKVSSLNAAGGSARTTAV